MKPRFPLLLVVLAFLAGEGAAQTSPKAASRRLKTTFARQPAGIFDQDVGRPVSRSGDQPILHYGKGAFRPIIGPAPPIRDDVIDPALPSSTPQASPTLSIDPSPSLTPSIVPSPTPVSTISPSPTPIPLPSPTPVIGSPTPVPSASVPMPTPSVSPGLTPTPNPSVPPPPPPPVVPPLPRPTISPVATLLPAQRATVTFSDSSSVQSRAAAGKFQLVALHPAESVNISLRVSSPSGAAMSVRALDGGHIVGPSTVFVADGQALIGFQAGSQPGLYRAVVEGSGTKALFQFWVSSAVNPATQPPVLNPTH